MSQSSLPYGRYLLLELLAEGGMAQVYRAVLRDASGFEKEVALKRVRAELSADPDFIARFVDEARIASTLSHSNIAQVFDFGQVDGEHYLAMELINGPDLGTLMAACRAQRQPIPITTATFVMAEVARGLGAAHRRSPSPVVHRDVSPQNVLLSRAGEVKVVDFGIALAAEKALRTGTGLVLGKCRYMAPEQARGEPLDPRADVFSAGCVLFELLAGGPLFDGDSPQQVLAQVLSAPIPPVSSRNPEVPPEIDEILAQALDRRPEARPADGGVLARELETLLHRMAPDFSSEDLVALIGATLPPPRRPAWQAMPTLAEAGDPRGDALALGDTERSVEPPTDVASAEGPPAPPPGVEPTPAPVSWEPPSVLAETGAAAEPTPPGSPSEPRRVSARIALVLLAAAALGALLGTGAGRAGHRTRSVPFSHGTTVQHAGWTFRLADVEHTAGALMVRLKVWAQAAAIDSPALASPRLELRDRRVLSPSFCASHPDGAGREWRLAFIHEPKAGGPIALELRPPGARPVRLVLGDGR